MQRAAGLLVVTALLAACSTPASEPSDTTVVEAVGCADVVGVQVTPGSDGYAFDVTVSSADTGWDKYADAWEVRLDDGTVVGTRELAHPHVEEQPFTRSLSDVTVPEGTHTVVVAARDSVEGFCGRTMTATRP